MTVSSYTYATYMCVCRLYFSNVFAFCRLMGAKCRSRSSIHFANEEEEKKEQEEEKGIFILLFRLSMQWTPRFSLFLSFMQHICRRQSAEMLYSRHAA